MYNALNKLKRCSITVVEVVVVKVCQAQRRKLTGLLLFPGHYVLGKKREYYYYVPRDTTLIEFQSLNTKRTFGFELKFIRVCELHVRLLKRQSNELRACIYL